MNFYQKESIDYFVNVSEHEGLPVSIMEAMSFGIPAIATNVGGTNEIVNDNKTGILLDKEFTNQDLTDAFVRLIKMDDKEYIQLRENCRIYWQNNFDARKNYNKFTNQLMNLSKALIDKRN